MSLTDEFFVVLSTLRRRLTDTSCRCYKDQNYEWEFGYSSDQTRDFHAAYKHDNNQGVKKTKLVVGDG